MPLAEHLVRGVRAEALAAAHLERRGLGLIARNFRCPLGELDLVARDGATLVIVEVRQRSRADFGGALGSITSAKRRRLVRAAQRFLQLHPIWRSRPVRFDVIAVHGAPGGSCRVEWIKGAFSAD